MEFNFDALVDHLAGFFNNLLDLFAKVEAFFKKLGEAE